MSKVTITRRQPHAGHIRRSGSRASGKSRPRVQTSVLRSRSTVCRHGLVPFLVLASRPRHRAFAVQPARYASRSVSTAGSAIACSVSMFFFRSHHGQSQATPRCTHAAEASRRSLHRNASLDYATSSGGGLSDACNRVDRRPSGVMRHVVGNDPTRRRGQRRTLRDAGPTCRTNARFATALDS